ncbi:hypothetical protein ACTZWW_12230 [Salinarimonas sp. NSM]|uniref:hypothetical protein n=1 Tax=Salinarimonas sp. NSM TaxID=3458003 RepID=UPI004036AF54
MTTIRRARLRIDLDDACVFSASSATTGGHRSLSIVPGAALLGLAASRLSDAQADLDRWTVLHGGAVRFGVGLPLSAEGRIGRPTPRVLHVAKADLDASAHLADGRLVAGKVENLARAARRAGVQLEPLKDGFLDAALGEVRVRKTYRLKTAIDRTRGVAADGLLFGAEAVEAGQSFLAEIEADVGAFAADPAADAAAFEALVALLASPDGRAARLGRSRSAEFGGVTITRLPAADSAAPGGTASGRVVVWVLSDLALPARPDADDTALDPADFGLDGGRFAPERSTLATRSYAPFNGRWGVTDVERTVIAPGSVLVFEDVRGGVRGVRRVGLHRAAGLGHVWIDPPLLAGDRPAAWDEPRVPVRDASAAPTGEPPALVAWMRARTGARDRTAASEAAVAETVRVFMRAYHDAENYLGAGADGLAGPSRAQWNAVAEAARAARGRSAGDLHGAVFSEPTMKMKNGTVDDTIWTKPVGPGRTHADVLADEIARLAGRSDLDAPDVLAMAADRMARETDRLRVADPLAGGRR